MIHDAAYFQRVGITLAALGGIEAIDRLATMSDDEARTWLAARTPAERDVIVLVLEFQLPAPHPDADLVALLALDERVLYGRLKTAPPEFRARFANYLQIREECRTGERLFALLDVLKGADSGQISAPDSV